MKKKITLTDVAKRADVSMATVSGILNEDDRFSPATVAHVRQVMRQLGYQPRRNKLRDAAITRNRAASAGTVTFIFPDPSPGTIDTPLSVAVLRGVEEALNHKRQHLVVTQLDGREPVPTILDDKDLQGVIMRTGGWPSPELLARLHGVPTVFVLDIAFAPAEFDWVRPDNEAIGDRAANYLISRGHKRLVAIWVEGHFPISVRAVSFQAACQRKGAACELIRCNTMMESAEIYRTMRNPPKAIFWPGSSWEFLKPMRDQKCRLGRDIDLVCGSDDLDEWKGSGPKIAAVVADPLAIGRAAGQQLLWRMNHLHEPPRRLLISPTLVV